MKTISEEEWRLLQRVIDSSWDESGNDRLDAAAWRTACYNLGQFLSDARRGREARRRRIGEAADR